MRLVFDGVSENESFARMAVAAFAVGALFIYLSALKKSSARFLRED